ncbi:fimbria/pilus periplasmic chaperone [Photobacterium damselae]|uniref:fimbria/pilus periplasmic chaperone n=1 Tax=Photobacterium damselae TaxID=38293 RepID=UPI002090A45B|nr:fimbria/pilus periplasmic chaperone [Photobacterium damselae]USR75075.1 fimbria/pilus periplasmic chaperone [Photobacterium damselae]
MNRLLLLLLLLLSSNSNAIAISSLFEPADKNGNASFSLINNDGKDMYINFKMAKVELKDGKKKTVQLDKNNLSNWEFSVTPSRMILKPNEQKRVKLKYVCKNDCEKNEDKLFYVDVAPVPYSESKKASLAIAFGYRVYFLVPASKIKGDYEINKTRKGFSLDNRSNTMLTAVLNTCTKEFSSGCIYQYRVLSGQSKDFSLPKEIANKDKIKFTVINPNEEFSESYLLH